MLRAEHAFPYCFGGNDIEYPHELFRVLNHRHDCGIGGAGLQDIVAGVRSDEVPASSAKVAEVVPERVFESCSPQVSWKVWHFFSPGAATR